MKNIITLIFINFMNFIIGCHHDENNHDHDAEHKGQPAARESAVAVPAPLHEHNRGVVDAVRILLQLPNDESGIHQGVHDVAEGIWLPVAPIVVEPPARAST